jgi:hypothetical protein
VDYSKIITTTAQKGAPFVVDAVHNSSVWGGRVLARTKTWDMGQYEQNPIQVAESTTGGDFVGLGDFDTSDESVDVNLQWTSKGYYQNITMSIPEISLNNTEAGIIKLTGRKMDIAKNAIQSAMGTRLYGLGGASVIEGLQLATDAGTYSSTYGSLSRTTYGTYINGQVTAASAGVISFATLAAQVDLCSAASNVQESVDLINTTKTIWGLVETIVEAKERGNYSTKGSNGGYMRVSPYTPMGSMVSPEQLPVGMLGFESYYFRGIPVTKDDKCPSGLIYTLNEKYQKFVSLPLVDLKAISLGQQVTKGAFDESMVKTTAFQITDERMPTNQLGKVAQIVIYGNYANFNPKRSGVMTGVTTT